MRERRNYILLMVAIAAALVGAVLLAVPGSPIHRSVTKGLDLQGGLEVVLKAVPPRGQQVDPTLMQTAQNIMVSRVDKLGVASPNVAVQGGDEIVIQLAGIHDPAKAAAIVGSTGQLQFFDFEKDLAAPTVNQGVAAPYPNLYTLLTAVQGNKGTPTAYYLFKPVTTTSKVKGKSTTQTTWKTVTQSKAPVSAPTKKGLLAAVGGKLPAGYKILGVPAGLEAVRCTDVPAGNCIGAGSNGTSPDRTYWYLFHLPPALTGKDLNEGSISSDFDPNTGQPEVLMSFTGRGSKAFQRITKAEYIRGQQAAGLHGSANTLNQQYAQHNAIVLDGVLKATPYIDYTNAQLQDGIVGGASIGNMGTIQNAQNLALVLQSGSLPYKFEQLQETQVSATLGKSSFHQAVLAALIGFVVVALFLLFLYRFLGLVAVVGLLIYGLLYYAAILLFNVTLTLPGFAGLILTIGVAADANVVVFERIKEEVRSGKSVRSAISAGYGKGFHTILDANVVTVITAMIIFLIAVADVKGFALMLLIGTVISLITAVAATRAMLGLLSGFRWFDNPRFMGAEGQQTAKWLQLDYIGKRRLWFAISGAVIVAGIIALGTSGLNLGIDFKGGTQVQFQTHRAFSTGQVSAVMARNGQRDAVVQGTGRQFNGDFKQWQIRAKALDRPEQVKLQQSLKNSLGAYGGGFKAVSGTFGHQIAIDAIYGIVVSLLLIVIYITIRFDLKYAIPVILAMLHDIAITVGVYALVGKEVSVATVAAVLTVLGYSIYDTIIIFDRIRENVPLMRRSPFATIANVSVWETIRRSLATTFITLLPIICLEILGGATLKDFAFALIVGVTSGAYSSIFIAAPLLTIWKEREPEYARRKAAAAAAAADPVEQAEAGLAESETALATEPTPELVDAAVAAPSEPGAQARREQRRQRRRSKPHGRAR